LEPSSVTDAFWMK